MTTNISSDFDDDDFLDETFRDIPDSDLVSDDPIPDFLSKRASSGTDNSVIDIKKDNMCKNEIFSPLNLYVNKNIDNNFSDYETIKKSELSQNNCGQIINNASLINSKCISGVTSKNDKRKFSTPTSFVDVVAENKGIKKTLPANKKPSPLQNIANSEFYADAVCLPSWQKLQKDVSSCSSLMKIVKCYNIHRVLYESSRKKLPKHLIVPVLCVLVKKFNPEEPSSVLFADDTDAIDGKINKEVLDMYPDCISEGTAIILKEVRFLCNVLLLKSQNIVSFYCSNGSTKYVQELSSVVDKKENLHSSGPLVEEFTAKQPSKASCNSTPVRKYSDDKFSKESNIESALNKEQFDDFDELLCNLDEKSFLEEI